MDKGLGLALLIGLGLWLWTRRAEAAPPEEPEPGTAAGIQIQVFDAAGHPVPAQSPVDLEENANYTVAITVTNLSTKAGEPWAADFDLYVRATVTGMGFLIDSQTVESFAAGETRQFSYSLNTPLLPTGIAGRGGSIDVAIYDPTGIIIAEGAETFYVVSTVAIPPLPPPPPIIGKPYISRILIDRLPEKGYHSWVTLYTSDGLVRRLLRKQTLKPSLSYPIGIQFNHLGGAEANYTIWVQGQSVDILALQGYSICGTAMAGEQFRPHLNTGSLGSYSMSIILRKEGSVVDTVNIYYDVL